jgi:hypothetical protein
MARVRDELVWVTIDGRRKRITSLEAAVRRVHNNVLMHGKPADLERLLRLYEKHAARPEADLAAEAEAAGEEVVRKMFAYLDRTAPDDEVPK